MMESTMTERRPVYHADLAALATERRRAMTDAALTDAGAAEAGLLRKLVAEIARLRDLLGSGTLDDAALYAVRRQLGDLRQCAEALGVWL
jgi:hypothetical protein